MALKVLRSHKAVPATLTRQEEATPVMMEVEEWILATEEGAILMMIEEVLEVGGVGVSRSLLYQLRRLGAVAMEGEMGLQVMISLRLRGWEGGPQEGG